MDKVDKVENKEAVVEKKVDKKSKKSSYSKKKKIKKNILFDPQKNGKLIFDGYPRSISQAKNLDLLLDSSNQKIDFIFFLNVNKETIIRG